MWSGVGEEILYEMRTELQVFQLMFCTVALVGYMSVKPCNKLLIDLACSVCGSEILELVFCTDLVLLCSFRSKNIGP